MRTITRYFNRFLAGRILAALLVFVALLELMDLLDNMGDVLERRGDVADVFIFAGLRLPTIVERVVPLSVLVGSIAAFLALANRNELVALRAAGMPPVRLVAAFLPACVAVVALHFVLADRIAPDTERAFTAWWDPQALLRDDALWLSGAEGGIVRIGAMSDDATRLSDVTVYSRDAEGVLTARLEAARALYNVNGWMLTKVARLEADSPRPDVERTTTRPWPDGPAPQAILEAVEMPERLSTGTLAGMLTAAWSAGAEPAVYRTELAHRYAGPLTSLVMVLLAVPAISGLRRSGGPLAGAALGLALGLSFMVVDGMFAALGRAGTISPALAAWAPLALFASIGGSLLLQFEE